MVKTFVLFKGNRCIYCGKQIYRNLGTSSKPMCERCWEKGGDDE